MGTLRFADIQTRPTEVLDLTSLTVESFGSWFRLLKPRSKRIWPMAPRWTAAYRPPVHDLYELSVAHARGSAALYPRLPEDVPPPSGAGAAVRDGPEQSPSVDSCPPGGPAGDAARAGGCSHPVRAGLAQRLGVAEANAAAVVVPPRPHPPGDPPAPAPASPLLATTGPNGASSAPRIRLSKRAVIAARKSAIP